jgi:hypothetical protein
MPDLSYIVGQRDWTVPMPKLILDPDEQAVRNIAGLNVWLEPGLDNMERDENGLFTAWVDRVSNRRFVPVGANKPLIVNDGTTQALRFGFGGALPGGLRAEDDASLLSAAGYTFGICIRFPVATANGGTELGAGATAYGNWLGSRVNATQYMVIGTNNQASTSARHNLALGPDLTYSSPRIDDGLWHTHIFSYDYAEKDLIYMKDGVLAQYNNNVLHEMLDTPQAALQLAIGQSGTGQAPMVGEFGGLFHVAGRALHISAAAADLAALEVRLNGRRLALSA